MFLFHAVEIKLPYIFNNIIMVFARLYNMIKYST